MESRQFANNINNVDSRENLQELTCASNMLSTWHYAIRDSLKNGHSMLALDLNKLLSLSYHSSMAFAVSN